MSTEAKLQSPKKEIQEETPTKEANDISKNATPTVLTKKKTKGRRRPLVLRQVKKAAKPCKVVATETLAEDLESKNVLPTPTLYKKLPSKPKHNTASLVQVFESDDEESSSEEDELIFEEKTPVEKTESEKITTMIRPPPTTTHEYVPKNKDAIVYKLVRIISSISLGDLLRFFRGLAHSETGEEPQIDTEGLNVVGCMRIDHHRPPHAARKTKKNEDYWNQYKEKPVTVASLHPAAVELLEKSDYWGTPGIYDVSITPYQIRKGNMPLSDCSSNLYFGLPKEIPHEESIRQVNLKMQNMVESGFVATGTYTIHHPRNSRDATGTTHNFCIITFSDEIEPSNRAAVKVLLDQTKFRGAEDPNYKGKHVQYMCRVSWAKEKIMGIIGSNKSKRYGSRNTNTNKFSKKKKPKKEKVGEDGFTTIRKRGKSKAQHFKENASVLQNLTDNDGPSITIDSESDEE
jgi:hypothetical protein